MKQHEENDKYDWKPKLESFSSKDPKLEYYGSRANSFLSCDQLAPHIKIGDSFDSAHKVYGISPNKRTIDLHKRNKAQYILEQFNNLQQNANDKLKYNKEKPLLWRFQDPSLHPYKKPELPSEVHDYFSKYHPTGIKDIQVGKDQYRSPFMSMSRNLRGLVNTDIVDEGGDPNIRNYVLDKAPKLSAYQIPKESGGIFFSKIKNNYITPHEDTKEIPGKEAEVLYDLQSKNPEDWDHYHYNNPLQNQIEPDLPWWKQQASKRALTLEKEDLQLGLLKYDNRKLLPTNRVLSSPEHQQYQNQREHRDYLYNMYFERANQGNNLYSGQNTTKKFHDLKHLDILNKKGLDEAYYYAQEYEGKDFAKGGYVSPSDQDLRSVGSVKINNISLTPEEARIAEVFGMSPAEYKKLQTARFKNQGNQA